MSFLARKETFNAIFIRRVGFDRTKFPTRSFIYHPVVDCSRINLNLKLITQNIVNLQRHEIKGHVQSNKIWKIPRDKILPRQYWRNTNGRNGYIFVYVQRYDQIQRKSLGKIEKSSYKFLWSVRKSHVRVYAGVGKWLGQGEGEKKKKTKKRHEGEFPLAEEGVNAIGHELPCNWEQFINLLRQTTHNSSSPTGSPFSLTLVQVPRWTTLQYSFNREGLESSARVAQKGPREGENREFQTVRERERGRGEKKGRRSFVETGCINLDTLKI